MKKITVRNVLILIAVFAVIAGIGVGMRFFFNGAQKSSYPLKYEQEVDAASKKYGVDKALIYAVIKTESNFDPNARSRAGAVGLMQIMEDTFTWMQTFYKDDNNYSFDDMYDPALNIDYCTEVLSVLIERYDGNEDTAVCAYNGGVGHVDSWLEDPRYSDDGKTLKTVPFTETENYRKIVARNKSIYTKTYFS